MTIIITGTSAGIGFALAEYFGKKGHHVFGLSRKNVESEFFTSIPTDITDHLQVEKAISEILKLETRIDVLINNAGMGMVGPVEDSTQEEILKKTLDCLNPGGVIVVRDGDSSQKATHDKIEKTEVWSTKIIRFNKTSQELSFVSSEWMQQFATSNGVDIKIRRCDNRTSETLYILSRKSDEEL